ncbi:potassium channel family protein [Streptomyces canus]|uniref:ion channel n=1 Tax=Streptomyces canus TaxID=58343 RepID=UPI00386D34F4|nr:potassium channel family protein [Streptomyces canus]
MLPYFALTTFSTVGFGDITARRPGECSWASPLGCGRELSRWGCVGSAEARRHSRTPHRRRYTGPGRRTLTESSFRMLVSPERRPAPSLRQLPHLQNTQSQ